jgi:ketosteroid isomerase-like protein
MIDRQRALHFAAEWIAAWNGHDLDAILRHYADDVVFHSPRIAVVTGEPIALVSGKPALARYWREALRQATDLRFELDRVYVGSDSISIAYRNQRSQHVTETFVFDGDGLVAESVATYA